MNSALDAERKAQGMYDCNNRRCESKGSRKGPTKELRAHMGNRVCTISNHFNPISASTVVGRPHSTCRKSWTCLYLCITYASCSSSTKCTVGLAKKKPVRSSMIYATQNTYRSSGVKCRSFINAKYAPPNV